MFLYGNPGCPPPTFWFIIIEESPSLFGFLARWHKFCKLLYINICLTLATNLKDRPFEILVLYDSIIGTLKVERKRLLIHLRASFATPI